MALICSTRLEHGQSVLVMEERVTPRLLFEDAVPEARVERSCQGQRFDVHQVASYSTCANSNHDQDKFRLSKSPGTQRYVTDNAFNLR